MKLGVAQRQIRLPHQHRLVELAAQQEAAKLAHPREVEAKQLLAGGRPAELAGPVSDEAVHRDAHRVDQHRFVLIAPERRTMLAKFTVELHIVLGDVQDRV